MAFPPRQCKNFFYYPPKPHAFVKVPLQSGILNLTNMTKYLSLPNIFTALTIFTCFYIVRTYILPLDWIFFIKITLLEENTFFFNIPKDLFLGILAVISRLFILGFWEEFLKAFLPEKLPIAAMDPISKNEESSLNTLYSNIDKGKTPGMSGEPSIKKEGSSGEVVSTSTSTNTEIPNPLWDEWLWSNLITSIRDETRDLIQVLRGTTEEINKYCEWPSNPRVPTDLKITSENADTFINILMKQSTLFTSSVRNRFEWIIIISNNSTAAVDMFSKEELDNFKSSHTKLLGYHANYLSKVNNISQHQNETVKVKLFYAALNQYRNESIREVNKCESILLENIKKKINLNKYFELRRVLNIEFIEAKKQFNDKDGYLRMKIGEVLQRK